MDREIRLDIQGLRAVAVILVVLFHADVAPFGGGFIGVDVFFVISGYVVTGSLLRNHLPFDAGAFGNFVRRRMRRILPALAAALTATVVLSAFLLPTTAQRTAWRTGGAASLIVANWALAAGGGSTGYFLSTAEVNPLLHTWSLSVEEQFYLGLPIVLLLAGRGLPAEAARRRFLAAFVGLGVLSFGLAILVVDLIGRYSQWTFYASPFRAWEFLVGCSLAAMGTNRLRVPHGWIVGLSMILGSALLFDAGTNVPGVITLIPVMGAAFVLQTQTTKGPLQWAPLVWIGDRSYGWYLWHWPAIVFAQIWWPFATWPAIAGAGASLLPAAASYRWLENPIRRRERAHSDFRLAGVCLVAPLLAVAGLAAFTRVVPGLDQVERLERASEAPETYALGCHGATLISAPKACTFGESGGSGRSILLTGDSNAAQLVDAVIAAGTNLGAEVTVVTKSGCPPVLLVVHDGRGADGGCYEWFKANSAQLDKGAFDVIVVASASDLRIQQVFDGRTGSPVSLTPTDPPVSDPAGVAEIYEIALGALAEQVGSTGAELIIVHPIPRPTLDGRWHLTDCATAKVLWNPGACAISFADGWDERRAMAVGAEEAIADQFDWVSTIDLAPVLCGVECAMLNDQGDWLWRDNGHIGREASETIQPLFDAAFAKSFADP